MEARSVKWWGWGWEDVSLPVESRPVLWKYLQTRLRLDPRIVRRPARLEEVRAPPCLLSPEEIGEIEDIVGEGNVSIVTADRVAHAAGRSYPDLLRLRSGILERAPDAVLYPEDEDVVRRVLDLSRRRRYAIVPFGGGTSVVGGVDPPAAERVAAVLTLDLRRLRRVVEIDEMSGLVTAEAGIRGPLLEEALRAKGLTLGHFPQSWEFSTLGGWIATRAAGGFSNRYGRIDALVVGMRLFAQAGIHDLPSLPGEAHGPDLRAFVLGSEGILGVITRATLRAHPLPTARRFASRLFRTFAEGLGALRTMARDGSLPDMTYLSDEEETRFLAANAGISPDGTATGATGMGLKVLGMRGYSLAQGSLLLMAFEGSPARVAHRRRRALRLAVPAAGAGSSPARRWFDERFAAPYLRDSLIDHGILVETVETAAPWSRLLAVHDTGAKALRDSLWTTGTAGLVLCHVSHVYTDGASLYFTFFGRQMPGQEETQWKTVKEAVTRAFVDAGGALSHHHGIGADHAPFLGRVIGEDGLAVLRALKRQLDPEGIMNPGKVLAGGP